MADISELLTLGSELGPLKQSLEGPSLSVSTSLYCYPCYLFLSVYCYDFVQYWYITVAYYIVLRKRNYTFVISFQYE